MGVWYEGLRVAILQQAAKDYIAAIEYHRKSEAANLECFFRSEWGQLLSGDTGELIIAKCEKIAQTRLNCDGMKRYRKK